MSRSKMRNFLAVVFVGLFLITHSLVFVWILVGVLVLLHGEGQKTCSSGRDQNLLFQIGDDARKNGLRMPRQQRLRSLLTKIYRCYNASIKKYPQFKKEYREVLDEMWLNLVDADQPAQWEEILSSVLSGWPSENASASEKMKETLEKVRNLSRQWDEAKSEAIGGTHV